MRKGEIAFTKQFLLSAQCFPQLYIFSASKCGIVGNGLNYLVLLESSIQSLLCSLNSHEETALKWLDGCFDKSNDLQCHNMAGLIMFIFPQGALLDLYLVH